jgi:hypothetical protein
MKKRKPKRPLFQKPKPLFKAVIPDLALYIGRNVTINGLKVKIKKIVGNLGMTLGRAPEEMKPCFYEINDEYLIGMLRFHAQMNGDRSITEEQFQEFENMVLEAEKIPSPPKKEFQ